ncbi:MAG: cytochrome P450 [Chloroflexi bacterium]|nr:cytochrome P450 [Chloroflexota bacterium]MCI0837190.1 cytochrome P450 [Chloroflexota bacterium]
MPFGIGKQNTGNLPPGSMGWPILGEALTYARSPHTFMESRARKHGSVFKTRILGSKIICFVGPGPFSFLVANPQFDRAGAAPGHISELLCNESLPLIDGANHTSMRGKVEQAFTPQAIGAYLKITERLLARYIERWESLRELAWADEFKLFSAALCSALLLGPAEDFEADAKLAKTLDEFLDGVTAIPINLPFTTYGKAIRRRDDLLSDIDRSIASHGRSAHDDMLSRLMAARDSDGSPLAPGELRAQMVHLFFAAYGGIYRVLALQAMNLAQHPDVRDRVMEEFSAVSPNSLDLATLLKLEYLDAVTREVRRNNRLFASNFFDNVTQDTEYAGFDIPRGWKVTGVVYQTMQDESVFAEPDRFDPDRFTEPRREQDTATNAYIPHGGGDPSGHRCPAEDFATLLMQQTAVSLMRSHSWDLVAGQDLSLTGGPSPMPRDGIRVVFTRKPA